MASIFSKFFAGLRIFPKSGASTAANQGDLDVTSSDGKLNYHDGSSASPVVTEAHAATLTNKIFDADATGNQITNIENADIKSGAAIAHSKMAALTASKALVSDGSGVVVPSTVTATELDALLGIDSNIQDQLDAGGAGLSAHIADSSDAHDASAISFVATGTIAATDAQAAIEEVAVDAAAALATHEADTTSIHGIADTSVLVTLAGSQTLSNKTLSSPAITTPTGIVKGDVGLGNVDNTSDATKNAAAVTLTNKTLTSPVINTPTGIVKGDVGLGNVDNTSDATKNAAVATLTNKTLTSPVINTPTGIVKGDVGLGNVDNTSDATKNAAAVTLTNKTLTSPVISSISNTGTLTLPTATDTLIGRATTDTLTNKTLTSPTITTPTTDILNLDDQASTPATPSSGFVKLYAKTDGKVYKLTSAGAESEIGAGGSGAGGINYISQSGGNSDAETNTTGWTTYADATATPVDLTGGSPTATLTRSTTNPLRGVGSFLFTKGGLGDGVAYTITPDRADIKKGAVLYGSFDYEVSATTATGDYTVWIYDVANSVLIQPTGYQIQGGVSGTGYKHIFSFQLPTNGTTFRVAVHQAVASPAGNITVDNVSVGPQTIQYGAPVTDWVSYTPTGTWTTNSTYTGFRRRVGDSEEYQINITLSGAPTSASLVINLASGRSIDTAKIVTTTAGYLALGGGRAIDAGNNFYPVSVSYNSTTSVSVTYPATVSGTNPKPIDDSGAVTASVPATWGSGDSINVTFRVPITGWSSTVQMSNDTDTRVVAAQYATTAGQAITGIVQIIDFGTKENDTHAAVTTGASWKFTAPSPGYYHISPVVTTASTSWTAGDEPGYLQLHKNGSGTASVIFGHLRAQRTATDVYSWSGSKTIYLNAGDYIDVRISSGASYNLHATTGYNHVSIERLSGPSAIAASESVNARYNTGAATQSIANGATSIIDFGTKVFDSHSAVTTGASWKFTAPISGKFSVKASARFGNAAWTAGNTHQLQLFKNGSLYSYLDIKIMYATSTHDPLMICGGSDVEMIAGDYIDVRVAHAESAARSLQGLATINHISISKVGN